jgi:hypothetical protein
MKKLDGFETCVVAYTTDIPAFDGAWGEPLLLGPAASTSRTPTRSAFSSAKSSTPSKFTNN